MPVQSKDLTAKARIREAALELFARDGFEATSMRSVAALAGVSPSLVVHHFGTRAGLRDAVDAATVAAFEDALATVDLAGTPTEVSLRLEVAISALIGADPAVRGHLARSLADGGDAGHRLFDALMDLVDAGLAALEERGHVRAGLDPAWRSYTAAFVILGPVLLGDLISNRSGSDAFAPDAVRRRSACHLDILRRGLFDLDRAR